MLEWSTKIELHVVAERIKRIRESDDLSLEWILECNGIILPLSSVLPSSAATTPQRKQLRLEINEQAAYSRLVGVRFAPKSEEKSDENLISFRDWYRSHRASHQPVAESDIIELGASGTWDGWSVRPADVPSRVVFGFQMLVHQVDRAKDGWYYEADSSLESLLDQCMEAKDPVAHIVHWDLNRFSNLNDFALHCLGHAADEGSPAANYIRWTCKPTPESEYETESEYSYESEPELVDRIESKTQTVSQTKNGGSPNQTVSQAASGSTNQAVSQAASGCPNQTVSQAASVSTNQTVSQAAKVSTNHTVSLAASGSPNQTVNQAASGSTNQTVSQAASGSTNQTVSQAASGSTNQTVSQSANGSPDKIVSQNEHSTSDNIIESSHPEIQTTAKSDQKCDSQSTDASVESPEPSNSQSPSQTFESDSVSNQSPSLTADHDESCNAQPSDKTSDTTISYSESDSELEWTPDETILSDTISSEQASDNIKSSQPNEHSQLADKSKLANNLPESDTVSISLNSVENSQSGLGIERISPVCDPECKFISTLTDKSSAQTVETPTVDSAIQKALRDFQESANIFRKSHASNSHKNPKPSSTYNDRTPSEFIVSSRNYSDTNSCATDPGALGQFEFSVTKSSSNQEISAVLNRPTSEYPDKSTQSSATKSLTNCEKSQNVANCPENVVNVKCPPEPASVSEMTVETSINQTDGSTNSVGSEIGVGVANPGLCSCSPDSNVRQTCVGECQSKVGNCSENATGSSEKSGGELRKNTVDISEKLLNNQVTTSDSQVKVSFSQANASDSKILTSHSQAEVSDSQQNELISQAERKVSQLKDALTQGKALFSKFESYLVEAERMYDQAKTSDSQNTTQLCEVENLVTTIKALLSKSTVTVSKTEEVYNDTKAALSVLNQTAESDVRTDSRLREIISLDTEALLAQLADTKARSSTFQSAISRLGLKISDSLNTPDSSAKASDSQAKASDSQANASDSQAKASDSQTTVKNVRRQAEDKLFKIPASYPWFNYDFWSVRRRTLLRTAAHQGHRKAQFDLGYSYTVGGEGFELSVKKGLKWIRRACDNGDVQAMNFLAQSYREGTGVSRDLTRAVSLFRDAIDLGCRESQEMLGELLIRIHPDEPEMGPDVKEGIRLLKLANTSGSHAYLGFLYAGILRCLNAGKAKKSAGKHRSQKQQKPTPTKPQLTVVESVEKNVPLAARHLAISSALGNYSAGVSLAGLVDVGKGLTVERSEAVRLYRRVAQIDTNQADANQSTPTRSAKDVALDVWEPLGYCLETLGEYTGSRDAYKKAYDGGVVRSAIDLARLSMRGQGGPVDRTEARRWVRAAEEGGCTVPAGLFHEMDGFWSSRGSDDTKRCKAVKTRMRKKCALKKANLEFQKYYESYSQANLKCLVSSPKNTKKVKQIESSDRESKEVDSVEASSELLSPDPSADHRAVDVALPNPAVEMSNEDMADITDCLFRSMVNSKPDASPNAQIPSPGAIPAPARRKKRRKGRQRRPKAKGGPVRSPRRPEGGEATDQSVKLKIEKPNSESERVLASFALLNGEEPPVTRFPISSANSEYTFGRSENCDIFVDHPSVNLRHAMISVIRETGQLTLTPLFNRSDSVLKLNGVQVAGNVVLSHNDLVHVGPVGFVFEQSENFNSNRSNRL
eukprot:124132_1